MKLNIPLLCKKYNLGKPMKTLVPVTGGLLHQMFKLTTPRGSFAIKWLNPQIMKRQGAINNYITSEIIASAVSENGLPAVAALSVDGSPLQIIDDIYVLVFNWIEEQILPTSVATPKQCRIIGFLLAKIHQLDFSALDLSLENCMSFSEEHWADLTEKGITQNLPWAEQISKENLIKWTHMYEKSSVKLQQNLVVSHRDLDQKNVLWADKSTPFIIDWEAAGLINPTKDLVNTAILWSGEGTEITHRKSFEAIIAGYLEAEGLIKDDIMDALHSNYQERVEWLEFNMRRSLGREVSRKEEQELGITETLKTIQSLDFFAEKMDMWYEWIRHIAPRT